ncbi:MAG: recombinase family protein, partial [Vicinamibacterales bacterium]
KEMANRPGLLAALDRVETGAAQILMVSKLDRLSRSVHDFTGLLQRAERRGWALIACDLGVDTSTPAGEAMANVMASFAQLERKLIGQRTSDALQAKKRAGATLGRPDRTPPETVARIRRMRNRGATLQAIADRLNRDGVPTSQGGAQWWPSTVAAVLRRPVARSSRLEPAAGGKSESS